MPRLALALLSAALMLVAPVLAVDHASAATTTTADLRVMLSGDSITQGFSGSTTWRYYLYQEFQRQDVPVDFVGYHDTIHGEDWYLHPDFDRDNSALGGTKLATQVDLIGGYVATYTPDVVVVLLGRNDLDHAGTNEDVDRLMRQYVANVRASKPDVAIVIGEIPEAVHQTATGVEPLPSAKDFDSTYLPQIQTDLTTPESPIAIAHLTTGWDPRRFTFDGVHPNATGETLVAQRMADALSTLGYLGASSIYCYVAWDPRPRPTALTALSHHRLKVTWDASQVQRIRMSDVRVSWRRTGGAWRRTPKLAAGGQFAYTVSGLSRGTYEVRIQPIRQWMEGRYGPTARARVS